MEKFQKDNKQLNNFAVYTVVQLNNFAVYLIVLCCFITTSFNYFQPLMQLGQPIDGKSLLNAVFTIN